MGHIGLNNFKWIIERSNFCKQPFTLPKMVFSSSSSEQCWVHQISKTFENHLDIDISPPACVFHVPQSLSAAKPEAYVPQQIGLGPYHHLRPNLHRMQRHKFAKLKTVLNREQILNFSHLVIDRLKELEPAIRASYDTYLELDADALSWILAIDGLFLFGHLNSIYEKEKAVENIVVAEDSTLELPGPEIILQSDQQEIRTMEEQTEGEKELLKLHMARDMLMLENQIPAIVLIEIQAAVQHFLADEDKDGCNWLGERLWSFCKVHSPLELCSVAELPIDFVTKRVHLLDYMYYCIVNHVEVVGRKRPAKRIKVPDAVGDIEKGLGILGLDRIAKPFKLIEALPWDKISDLLDIDDEKNENKALIEEIVIPSVSELCKIAKVDFKPTKGGIRSIDFNHDTLVFKLPVITLTSDSEVILRNLVAYEASLAKPASMVAEYVDLMCGMIDTAEDATLLRDKQIIKGELQDVDVAKLFNGISKSTHKSKRKSNLEVAIERVNEDFGKRMRVKAYRVMKKYVFASWKMLSFSATLLIILLLIFQSFCQLYGCSTRIFGRN